MIVTLQGKNVLVTAYPYADGIRAQVSLAGGAEAAAGDVGMVDDIARELDTAGKCLGAIERWIKGESGGKAWRLDA